MDWIDSHCHLDSIEDQVSAVLERATDAGVTTVITVGTDLRTSRWAIETAESHPSVRAVVGIHPHDAESATTQALTELEALAGHQSVVAVGEIGLDYYRNYSPKKAQREAFAAQLEIAGRLRRPVVIHMRDAFDEVFEILTEQTPEKLVFHCFSGGPGEASRALDLGGFLSFAGNVSFSKAEDLRESARATPLDRILVETDSPFLAPTPHRGKRNEPAYVPLVGAALAAAIGVGLAEVSELTSANARSAFLL